MFNDVKLIVLLYHVICFSMFVSDPEVKYYIGFSCSATIILGILTNLTAMSIQPTREAKRSIRICIAKRKAKTQLKIDKPKIRAKDFHARRVEQQKINDAEIKAEEAEKREKKILKRERKLFERRSKE